MTRPTREEMEEQLVWLLDTESAAEAQRLVELLRQQGILAVANAQSYQAQSSRYGRSIGYQTFVLVHENDLDEANAILDELFEAEGNVPDHVIEDEMAAAEADPDAASEWYHQSQRKQRRKGKLFALVIGLFFATTYILLSLK